MEINAKITKKAFSGEAPIKHVDYRCESNVVTVTVTHADTWDYDMLKPVSWADLTKKYPNLAKISFQDGNWLLTADRDSVSWEAVRQR